MESVKSRKKWVLVVVGLLLALLVVKAVLIFTAKPKVTVDYVTEYNRLARPANYGPNENAAPHYQKAFDVFVRMPNELRNPYATWPTDYNNTYQNALEEWLNSNELSFKSFSVAANKPYYWLERTTKNNSVIAISIPELSSQGYLVEAVVWNAKFSACEKLHQAAFEDILACYRAGAHMCRTLSLTIEQMHGLEIKQTALAAGFEIISREAISSTNLQAFQRVLEEEIIKDTYTPSFEAEKLLIYDVLQRTFVDNGRGTRRLAWKKVENFFGSCGEEYNRRVFLSCFIGPTRNEMAERIEEIFASFEPVKTETPWQLHMQDPNYFDRIDATQCEDFFLGTYILNPLRLFQSYHQTKTQEQAFLATLAVLRFKNDNNHLPDTLNELISAGYLKSIPLDPYSNGSLVYRAEGNNFTLYSVGENFKDDGGQAPTSFMATISWHSIIPDSRNRDLLFWPVKGLRKGI